MLQYAFQTIPSGQGIKWFIVKAETFREWHLASGTKKHKAPETGEYILVACAAAGDRGTQLNSQRTQDKVV